MPSGTLGTECESPLTWARTGSCWSSCAAGFAGSFTSRSGGRCQSISWPPSVTQLSSPSLHKSAVGVRFAQACCAAQSVRWARRKRRAGLRTQCNDVHCWVMAARVASWYSKTGVAAVAVSASSAVAGQHFVGAAQRRPNPSVNRRANGTSPGPGRRYVVHFRQPGPGAAPSSPGYLKR